jgi:hypothetical protein
MSLIKEVLDFMRCYLWAKVKNGFIQTNYRLLHIENKTDTTLLSNFNGKKAVSQIFFSFIYLTKISKKCPIAFRRRSKYLEIPLHFVLKL